MGCLDFDGVQKDVLNGLARLSTNLNAQNYDSSGLGLGLDAIGETIIEDTDLLQQILIREDRI
jgi:hypothetical protein